MCRTSSKGTMAKLSIAMLLTALVVTVSGCRGVEKQPNLGPATLTDSLMQVYPELRHGFATIADFEDQAHMELFQIIGVSDEASCVLDEARGKKRTGGHCAVFTTASDDDAILIGNDIASNWYMKRDWRPYDLLMISIKTPTNRLSMKVLITAGPDDQQLAVETSIALVKGWNLVRLDLAELGDHIPLDDVRDIRLSAIGVDEPIELILDDILLTKHSRDLMGSPRTAEGSLYVQQVGRRWKVGAAERFELTFSHGQIVEWYHLPSDPHRLRNLVRDTILGPSPVVIDNETEDDSSLATDFTGLGTSVKAQQRIVEMTPVRIVMACQWHFVDPDTEKLEGRPFQRWTYTIYPTGQIFVAVTCTASTPSWSPPQLGLAVSIADPSRIKTYTHSIAQLEAPEPLRHVLYATARGLQDDGPLLLFTMYDSHATPRMLERTDETPSRRLTFVATGPLLADGLQEWNCQLTLAGNQDIPGSEVMARVLDYTNPAKLDFEVGASAISDKDDPGRAFDPVSGCYVLRPESGELRFTIPGQQHQRFSPVFTVRDAQGLRAWIYVDHLIFKSFDRDADGNLVFQLPGPITKNTLVDVLLRKPSPAPLED